MYRLNVRGFLWLRFNLFTDSPDVDVYAAGCDGTIIPPNAIEQLVPRENHAWMRSQVVKQPELERAQLNRTSGDINAVGRGIDDDIAAVDSQAGWRHRFVAAQKGANASNDFTSAKRLRDIVIGTQLQSNYPISLLASSGQNKNRRSDKSFVTPQLTTNLESIQSRKH